MCGVFASLKFTIIVYVLANKSSHIECSSTLLYLINDQLSYLSCDDEGISLFKLSICVSLGDTFV